jgi:hypothetical protein
VTTNLMAVLWRVNVILVLDGSLLQREYNPARVVMAFPLCSLHLISFRKITPKYFAVFAKEIFCPCQSRSQSYLNDRRTVDQSVFVSVQNPVRAAKISFSTMEFVFRQLRCCFAYYGAPSLTRGRACRFRSQRL